MLLKIDNRWIVLYNPLFSPALSRPTSNVEFANMVNKSSMSAYDAGHFATGSPP